MDEFDATEVLRLYWLDRSDTISSQQIISATCPFCGKSDRIHVLNQDDKKFLASDNNYWAAWEKLCSSESSPAFCQFCQNVVIIRGGHAEMPG